MGLSKGYCAIQKSFCEAAASEFINNSQGHNVEGVELRWEYSFEPISLNFLVIGIKLKYNSSHNNIFFVFIFSYFYRSLSYEAYSWSVEKSVVKTIAIFQRKPLILKFFQLLEIVVTVLSDLCGRNWLFLKVFLKELMDLAVYLGWPLSWKCWWFDLHLWLL